jgi:laccase
MFPSFSFASVVALAASAAASSLLPRSEHSRLFSRQNPNDPDCVQVSVSFHELRSTAWGESISVVGSIPQLGDWDPTRAIFLSASSQYSNDNPLWSTTVNMPPGTSFQYKYILFDINGNVVWEQDPNHSYTVPTSCSAPATQSDVWQSTSAAPQTTTTPTIAPEPVCTNGPTTRDCWDATFSIDTDFDSNFPTTGVTVHYDWTITNVTMAPDGVPRAVFAINGQYPGPAINANWGDYISITVKNQLPNNGTSIHWHGLRQWHKNTQDGVPGISECPIAPNQQKTYTFQATQYGTSWYHSHFSCQYGDGIVGPIVIQGPATANYDVDVGPLAVADWYYETVNTLAARVQHVNAGPPTADTALINGKMVSSRGGQYERTMLQQDKKHRVRLINMSVDNHFMVSLDNHQMEVISSDFVPIVPYNTTHIFLGIGQRYDVIITGNQPAGSYWFRAESQNQAGCGNNGNNGNILSIFSYEGHQTETPISAGTAYTQRCVDEQGIEPYWNSYVPTGEIANNLTPLDTWLNQTLGSDGTLTLYWNVNGSSLNADWSKPTLQYVKNNQLNSFPQRANVIELPTQGQWTYWVIRSVPGNPYNVQVPHPIRKCPSQ